MANILENGAYTETIRKGLINVGVDIDFSFLTPGLTSMTYGAYDATNLVRLGTAEDYAAYILNKGIDENGYDAMIPEQSSSHSVKAMANKTRLLDYFSNRFYFVQKFAYDRTFGHYIKYAMRNAMDIATLGTSVNARLSEDKKTFDRVRIAFGVAGPVPMRAPHAEEFINGKPVTLENIEDFGKAVLEDIHPRDSWRASKAFRSHIAVESAKRCLMESVKLAGGEL